MSVLEIQNVFDTLGIEASSQPVATFDPKPTVPPKFEVVFSSESNPFAK